MHASSERQEVEHAEHFRTSLRSQSDQTVIERRVEAIVSIITPMTFLEDHDWDDL